MSQCSLFLIVLVHLSLIGPTSLEELAVVLQHVLDTKTMPAAGFCRSCEASRMGNASKRQQGLQRL